MRAAAILGLGCSLRDLSPFQQGSKNEFSVGLPASGEGLDAILIFGGDGTLHRHLGALVRLGLPVLVVPAGSGNDFARALGFKHARDSEQTWRKFAEGAGSVRTIDLGVITPQGVSEQTAADTPGRGGSVRGFSGSIEGASGPPNPYLKSDTPRYFACVAGIGLDAEIARRANGLPRWLRRRGGYAMALPPALLRYTPLPTKVFTSNVAEGGSFELRQEGPMMLAAFANTPFYGDGMKIAPEARLDDGEFDVCLVDGMNAFRLAWLFPSVYSGRHLRVKQVHYFKAIAARVETEHPLDVYADGEFVCRTPAEFSVARGALRVMVP